VAAISVIPAGGGEVIGDSPDRRVEILSDHPALHVTWSRFGPHRDGADLHVHHRQTDLFYVLAGEMTLRLGPAGDEVALRAGTLAWIPRLVVHGFRNGTGAELRYLNVHAPGEGFADYLRALRDGCTPVYDQHPPPADGGRPPAEAIVGGDRTVTEGPGLRRTLLADLDEVWIAETTAEPGAPPVAPRADDRHIASFYVLAGELVLTAGAHASPAAAGAWVHVPPGVEHAVAFPGTEPAHFLELRAPIP
jgi:mannose-6-phosphate isomerase-like protein (cupin superfamily)